MVLTSQNSSISGSTSPSLSSPSSNLILKANFQAYFYTNLIAGKTEDPLASKWQRVNLF